MKDKTILQLLTAVSIGGWALLFRKGPIKDWFLVYLFKTIITTIVDGPVVKKKLLEYPYRPFKYSFDTNIIFDYVLFPSLCVLYSQFTYKLKALPTAFSALFFSGPMTFIHWWLARNTRLVKYSRNWSWLHTLFILTMTFWSSRVFIAWIRMLSRKRTHPSTENL